MNERIKELMPQPWIFSYTNREMYSKDQMEHLAEMIIKECIEIAQNVCLGDETGEHGDTVNYVISDIKRHFGIK